MRTPGPKTTASLAVVPLAPRPKLKPPRGFTKPQAAVWRAAVASYPAEWWDGADKLLASYCRHSVEADLLAADIDALPRPLSAADMGRYSELAKLRDHETGKIVTLCRALRLSPVSRHRRETAGSRHGAVPTRKPWET
jgi:hypothetical protein